jgi:alkylation response protein AidB-like acyl-CoA dehydrogenase
MTRTEDEDEHILPAEIFAEKKKLVAFIAELQSWEAALPRSDDDQPIVGAEIAKAVRDRSKELGFYYRTQGKQLGGTQAGPLMLTSLYETLAASQLRLASHVWGPGEGFMSAVVANRAEFPYLDEHYLKPLLTGEKTSAFGFTEPVDAPQRTKAVVEGENFRINGVKSYVSGGDKASFVCVLANVVPQKAGEPGGSTMIIVDRDAPGVTIERVFRTISGSTHAWMVFNDVIVPVNNAIGAVGEGLKRGLQQIGHVRLTMCANAVGKYRMTSN